ncbi:hypothetical protein MJA45_11860 [Paenibacillus aurantius]|uniref:Uncharacterized protein n=1 Tax=Paenibacillus aurantius TaxID=2918900 RepID=A0AA96RHL8_9BACL|nr:hypothetical protein [Paenibacillus aurantius]WNQ13676.1 hypothetical protein MJA45_11860 [Paenibacillus aurantius]
MPRWLALLGFSLAAALLMSGFILVTGMIKYVFSLGALFLGIQFFKTYDGKGIRIGFIAITFVLALFLPVLYVALAVANGWPVDPRMTEGISTP